MWGWGVRCEGRVAGERIVLRGAGASVGHGGGPQKGGRVKPTGLKKGRTCDRPGKRKITGARGKEKAETNRA